MKMKIMALALLPFLISCGSNSSDNKKADTTPPPEEVKEVSISDNPDYQKGIALVGKNDCLTCHKIDEKLIGPSYREVANKYASMPDTMVAHLAGKIIHGGSGVWGEVAMTPHADLSKEDAEAMVKYILLLKK